jgi:hypothetical protein
VTPRSGTRKFSLARMRGTIPGAMMTQQGCSRRADDREASRRAPPGLQPWTAAAGAISTGSPSTSCQRRPVSSSASQYRNSSAVMRVGG